MNKNLDKRMKYSLGIGIENNVLDCMELLIKTKSGIKPMKAGYLIEASSLLEIILLKLRLFLELKLANETTIFQIQNDVKETGRMLGGWLKSLKST